MNRRKKTWTRKPGVSRERHITGPTRHQTMKTLRSKKRKRNVCKGSTSPAYGPKIFSRRGPQFLPLSTLRRPQRKLLPRRYLLQISLNFLRLKCRKDLKLGILNSSISLLCIKSYIQSYRRYQFLPNDHITLNMKSSN